MTSRRWPVLAIFILSGAAGLMYEVVWSRQLVLVFGNTTQAVSTILTGFFGGMAIGSWGGGRLADRVRRPLLLYGLLEAILVVVVLLTPLTFRLIGDVYRGAFTSLEAEPQALALVRFGLALLALAPATILMGATLPTLTRYLSRDAAHLSSAFGRLYAANTIGAIIGAAAAGLVLIEVLGLTQTLVVAACCSGAAGLTAIVIDRKRRATASAPVAPVAPPTPEASAIDDETPDEDPRPRIALVVAFVSGLTSLAYQVLWTRLLASGTGNYTYVFTLILVVFLTGIAIGAVLFTLVRRWIRRPVALLARTNIIVGFLALAGVIFVLSEPVQYRVEASRIDGLIGVLFWRALVVVLPATIIMGLSFPASSALVAGRQGKVATSAGQLLAANTLGAIVGTFVVPFFVIPAIGSPDAIGVIALVNVILGIILAYQAPIRSRAGRITTYSLGAVTAAVLVIALATNGILVDPSVANIEGRDGELFASHEDEIASVQAGSVAGYPELWVTGTSMTLLTVDAKLMPILPLMLRPESTSALTVAFGMGSAFRSGVIAGLTTDAVELVPSVPPMFAFYYPDAAQILANPNGHVIIADGRNHMELTDTRYDIIVTDPPPPIESSGVSVISSLEYYRAGHDRLTPGGIMMQWVPYGQTIDEFRAHVRTFADVFPNVLVLRGPGGWGFFMMGSDQRMAFSDATVREVLARPGILEDISGAYDSPQRTVGGWAGLIPSLIWIRGGQVTSFAGPGPLVTDDRPLPEYFLLRRTFGEKSPLVSPQSLAEAGFPFR
jgi:spermidine synthase